jgi:hypothetical protein
MPAPLFENIVFSRVVDNLKVDMLRSSGIDRLSNQSLREALG